MLDPRGGEADGARLEGVRQLAGHERQVVRCGLLLEGSFAHGPGPQGGVPDIGGEVDALVEAVDGVEILGERLEAPVDPFGQRHRVDVLGPLEVADHQGPCVGADRGQGEAAVAHHRRRHAVPARAAPRRVPEDLGIHVGVPVDEPRGDGMALGVDLLDAALGDLSHRGDTAVDHPHIGPERSEPGTVDDGPASDHDVKGHATPHLSD